ncbi:unnamed protein product [Discosporangium mesarthrocarpum]
MIPAENLVSAAVGTPTKIGVQISDPAQVQGAAFALQTGVDALLLPPADRVLWEAAEVARSSRSTAPDPSRVSAELPTSPELGGGGGQGQGEALTPATVLGAREGGVGDRVCVDLIQALGEGEGMLVGSNAKLLAMVHAETYDTGFVPARPFRVNAGPVHSYTLMADGKTKYLSELCAGDQVFVVDWEGRSRAVAVGRLKVEMRPMIMVEFQGQSGAKGQVFLQQAETVRMVSPNPQAPQGDPTSPTSSGWKPLSVTDVEGGESILVREVSWGTHVGQAINSVVVER